MPPPNEAAAEAALADDMRPGPCTVAREIALAPAVLSALSDLPRCSSGGWRSPLAPGWSVRDGWRHQVVGVVHGTSSGRSLAESVRWCMSPP